MTRVLDPTNEATPDRRERLARPTDLAGLTVGLLDISKPRGDRFLDRIEERLTERGMRVERFRKPTFTKPAPVELRHEIATKCDLVIEAGKLKVTNTGNADTPIVHGQHPLLTLDVWEHAYYIDHRNARPKYVETFLDKLVNWEFAAENFANQGEGNQTGARSYGDAQEAFAKKQKAS